MRCDVRLLGQVLGEVLREASGQDLFEDVERLRRLAIAVRAGSAQDDEIARLVAGWPVDHAELVARAFTVYFHLLNLAEELQRIRVLRDRDTHGTPIRESLAAPVDKIGRNEGPRRLHELMRTLEIHPVFTAHPTEARRRAVITALQRITSLLWELDDDRLGPHEQAEFRWRLREEVDLLWRTSPLRVKAMGPLDEVRAVMAVFDKTIFRVVPAFYRGIDRILAGARSGAASPALPPVLRFGSWVGGDRDGNPHVTAQVTRETALIQANHVLRA
jgi:phosphoenolpyruvate carboxylase